MKISEAAVLEALSRVQDPDLNRDIVALGFVKNIEISGNRVTFDVELTTPACPVKERLRDQCTHEVESLGAAEVVVNMTARVRSAPVSRRQPVPGIRNILAVASGKGGVGKSTLCLNLALALAQSGARVGVMDCDIYGPSQPTMVGIHERIQANSQGRLVPHEVYGLKLISMGFLVDRHQAVSWRGPMLHKMLQQFLFQVEWGELDYLLLDLPPGTGDVQLTLTQSVPISAAVLVTTPQEVALRDAVKGLEMFRTVKVPVLGIIENMSYYLCGSCNKRHAVFQEGGGRRMAARYQIPLLGEIPLDATLPSELGKGEPVMVRAKDGGVAKAIGEVAGRMAAELSRASGLWAKPEPGALEV